MDVSTGIISINSRPAVVLHVDDNRAAQMIMRRALAGANVHSASSVPDAFKLYKKYAFDLVVTDFNLGDADGLDVVDMIRTSARSDVPILAVSSSMDEALAGRFLRMGANMAIMKPLDPAFIREIVNQLLTTPGMKSESARTVGVKCFAWIKQGIHHIFSPDCGVTAQGSTMEEAQSSLLAAIQKRHETLGFIRSEQIIDLSVSPES